MGRKILAETVFRVDKKRTLAFSILCQTIYCINFISQITKRLCVIAVSYLLFDVEKKRDFLGYVLGRWTFLGSSFSLMALFGV